MSTVQPKLTFDQKRCDRCGRCENACLRRAITVGRTYISVDWVECDACGACVTACDRRAIMPREATAKAAVAQPPRAVAPRAVAPRLAEPSPAAAFSDAARPVRRVSTHLAPAADGTLAWTLAEAGLVLGAVLGFLVLETVLLTSGPVRSLPAGVEHIFRAVIVTAYMLSLLAILVQLARRRDGTFASAFRLRGFDYVADTGWVVLDVMGVWLATLVYGVALDLAGITIPPSGTSDITRLFGTDAVGLVLTVVIAVFVGPFVEELVFRGVVLGALRARIGTAGAVVISAVIFAAYHANIWLFVPYTVVGIVLGRLAVTRRSLWPAIGMHALYNATSVLVAYSARPLLERLGG